MQVEIRCPSRELGPVMAKMRNWLDHHRAEPALFELAFLPAQKIRFRLTFQNQEAAAGFARAFDGQVLVDRNGAADLAA